MAQATLSPADDRVPQFIEVDPMSFFGNDSQWFWMMAQFFALSVTFVFIYVQVRAQAASNTFHQMDSLNQEWDSDRMLRQRLALYEHIAKQGLEGEGSHMLPGVANFCENISALAHRGHIRRHIVYDWWGAVLLNHWLLCGAYIAFLRKKTGGRAIYSQWETTALEFQAFNRHNRYPFGPMTVESAMVSMAESVERIRLLLEMAQVANTGSAPVDPATAGPRPTDQDRTEAR